MAEYKISYLELEKQIDEYISETENNSNLKKYKIEILSSLTWNFEQNDPDPTQERTLWNTHIETPSQNLLFHNYYTTIRSNMLDILKNLFTSGVIDYIIETCKGEEPKLGIALSTTIIIELHQFFLSIKKLNELEICIYIQAITHNRKYADFKFSELKSWLQNAHEHICDIHDKVKCTHLRSDKTCNLGFHEDISNAIISLEEKKILKIDNKNENKENWILRFKH